MGACGARAGGHRSPPRGHKRCAALGRPAGQQHAGQQPGRVGAAARPVFQRPVVAMPSGSLAPIQGFESQADDTSCRPRSPIHSTPRTLNTQSTPQTLPMPPKPPPSLAPAALLSPRPRKDADAPTRATSRPPRATTRRLTPTPRACHACRPRGRGEGRARRKGRQERALAKWRRTDVAFSALARAPPHLPPPPRAAARRGARSAAHSAARARAGRSSAAAQRGGGPPAFSSLALRRLVASSSAHGTIFIFILI